MAKQEAGNNGAAEYVARPDPLQLAFEAISDAERVQPAAGAAVSVSNGAGYAVLAQRAQLRGAADWFAQIDMRLADVGLRIVLEIVEVDS